MIQKTQMAESLSVYFDTIHFNKSAQNEYFEFLKPRDINIGRFNGIVLGMLDAHSLSDEELYWFAEYPGTKINVNDYYSDKEIKNYSTSKANKQKFKYPIIFENVLRVDADQWVTTITVKELCELYNNNILIYNPATQRNPKVKNVGGFTTYRININRRSVLQIRNLLERNLFISNDLSLNIRGAYRYDSLENEIIIEEDGLDVIDGFHRLMAIIELSVTDPEFDETFILNLMNFSEEKAKRFIAQQDKRNKINRSYSRSLDNTRYENLIVTRLNEDPDSCFYGRIKPFGENRIDSGKMIEAVGYLFKPQSNNDVSKMEVEIRNGLNAIVNDNPAVEETINDHDMRVALCCIRRDAINRFMKYKELLENIHDIRLIDREIGEAE